MTKDNLNSETAPELQAIMSEVAALKRDMATLVHSLKGEVAGDVASVRSVAGHLGDEALHAYENLAAQGERSVKSIGRKVEEQPATSLLIAIGFVGSRLLQR